MKSYYNVIMVLFLFVTGVVNAQNFVTNGDFEKGADPQESWRAADWPWNDDEGSIWVGLPDSTKKNDEIWSDNSLLCLRMSINPDVNKMGSTSGGRFWQYISHDDLFADTYEFSFDVNYYGLPPSWATIGDTSATGEIVAQVATVEDKVETFLVDQTVTVDSASRSDGWTRVRFDFAYDGVADTLKIYFRMIKSNNANGTALYVDNVYLGAPTTTEIKSISTPNDVNFAYPNPAKGIINITNSISGISNVLIRNIEGKVVFNGLPNSNQINVSDFNKGMYFVTLKSNHETMTQKIIIK